MTKLNFEKNTAQYKYIAQGFKPNIDTVAQYINMVAQYVNMVAQYVI